MVQYSLAQVKVAKGSLQGYFNRLLLEPIFDRSTWAIANFTSLTSNQLSLIGFCFGLGSAVAFFFQHFILGAVLFEVMNLFDTFDGRIARLKNFSTKWGMYVDCYCGFYFTFLMALGLMWGVYNTTGNVLVWPFGFLMYFLLIIHFVEGNVAGFIMGGSEKYKETVQKETMGLLTRIRDFTVRKGFREPFNMTDNQHVLFFILPILFVLVDFSWIIVVYWVMVVG